MEEGKSNNIVITQPPELDIDLEKASAWVNSEMNSYFEEENARFDKLLEIEQELYAPVLARARELGLIPDNPDISKLKELGMAEYISEFEEAKKMDDEYGVLIQPLPVIGHRQAKTAPYYYENEDDKRGQPSRSYADKGNGLMEVKADNTFSGNWDWSSCTLAEQFTMRTNNHLVQPQCSFYNHLGIVDAWGVFSPSTVQLDLYVFMFNLTQNIKWTKRNTLTTKSNMWIGVAGQTLQLPTAFTGYGYGNADKGDQLLVIATMIGRAKAPTGYAKLNCSCRLTSMSIAG